MWCLLRLMELVQPCSTWPIRQCHALCQLLCWFEMETMVTGSQPWESCALTTQPWLLFWGVFCFYFRYKSAVRLCALKVWRWPTILYMMSWCKNNIGINQEKKLHSKIKYHGQVTVCTKWLLADMPWEGVVECVITGEHGGSMSQSGKVF